MRHPRATEIHSGDCDRCEYDEHGYFDESRTLAALREQDHLEWHARTVANYVWELRWPAQPAPYFEMTFDTDAKFVNAGWWAHQDNQSESFPISYLWSSYAEIELAEHERREAARLNAQREHARRQAEGEAQERARLRSLLAKYPDEAQPYA